MAEVLQTILCSVALAKQNHNKANIERNQSINLNMYYAIVCPTKKKC